MMSDDENSVEEAARGMLDKFEPGSASGPIDDLAEREQRRNQLPSGERELAQESARLANLCQYFSQEKIDIPPDILGRIGRVSKRGPLERIRELADITQALMEYLNRAGPGSRLRQ